MHDLVIRNGKIVDGSGEESFMGDIAIDGNVRVVAQLIDIQTDDHLWANTYDRKLDDIFEVQSDISMNIANALEAELSPELTAELTSSATQDTRAYENYLKGKEQYSKYTEEGHRQA